MKGIVTYETIRRNQAQLFGKRVTTGNIKEAYRVARKTARNTRRGKCSISIDYIPYIEGYEVEKNGSTVLIMKSIKYGGF